MNTKLHFKRFEIKYQMPKSVADKMLPAFLKHMTWDPYAPGINKPYNVISLYFDTPNMDCYLEKLAGVKSRKKLRIRTYYYDIKPETKVFFEIKKKVDMVILKDRFVTTYENLQTLFQNNFFNAKNLINRQYWDDCEKFVYELKAKKMSPIVLVCYERKALQSKYDKNFRVTFDSKIRSTKTTRFNFQENFIDVFPETTILEVKFNNIMPYWFHEIITSYQLTREPFSKYCTSIYAAKKQFTYNITKI